MDALDVYLPSDTCHGAEAFGAHKRVSVTSAATVFTLQHTCHTLPMLCSYRGTAVSLTYTHTVIHKHGESSPSAAGPSFSESVESDS